MGSQEGGVSVNVGVKANGNVVTVRGNKYPSVLTTPSVPVTPSPVTPSPTECTEPPTTETPTAMKATKKPSPRRTLAGKGTPAPYCDSAKTSKRRLKAYKSKSSVA